MFFLCFSGERSSKVLISTFLSTVVAYVVTYVSKFDEIVAERIW